MASVIFTNQISNPNATDPTSLNLSLTSNGVNLVTLGSNAVGLLFNAESELVATTAVCSVTADNIKTVFRAVTSYNAKEFALLLNDGTSYTFTLATSTPNAQTLTFNGFDSVGPEKIRNWNLNG